MIRVNLLPWRAEKKKKQHILLVSGIAFSLLLILFIITGQSESSEPLPHPEVETTETRQLNIFAELKAQNDNLLDMLDKLSYAIPASLTIFHIDKQKDSWNIEGNAISKELITTLIKQLNHARLISLKELTFHIQIEQNNNSSSLPNIENLEELKNQFCLHPAELPNFIETATSPWQIESFQLEEKDESGFIAFSLILRNQIAPTETILSQLKQLNIELPFTDFSFTLSEKQMNLALQGQFYEIDHLYCRAPTEPSIKQEQPPDLTDALQLVGIIQTESAALALITWKDSSKIEKVTVGQFLEPIQATVVHITDGTLKIRTEAHTIDFILKE